MISRMTLIGLLIVAVCAPAFSGLEKPEIVAVKFHADWCGSCKKMGSTFEELRNKFDGKGVLFVTLDHTNLSTTNQAHLMASALGLKEAYETNKGTGFILLIDAKTKKVLSKLTASQNMKEMTGIFKNNLS